MSEKEFFNWEDEKLKSEISNLIKTAGESHKMSGVGSLSGAAGGTSGLAQIGTTLLTKAVPLQLERLNRKIDELIKKLE